MKAHSATPRRPRKTEGPVAWGVGTMTENLNESQRALLLRMHANGRIYSSAVIRSDMKVLVDAGLVRSENFFSQTAYGTTAEGDKLAARIKTPPPPDNGPAPAPAPGESGYVQVTRWRNGHKFITMVLPTPFGQDRAEEIWQARQIQGEIEGNMTDGEIAYVRRVWDTLPGTASFMTAFWAIQNGTVKVEP